MKAVFLLVLLFPFAAHAAQWRNADCADAPMEILGFPEDGFQCMAMQDGLDRFYMHQLDGGRYIRAYRIRAPFQWYVDFKDTVLERLQAVDVNIRKHGYDWTKPKSLANGTYTEVFSREKNGTVWSCFFHVTPKKPNPDGLSQVHDFIQYCDQRKTRIPLPLMEAVLRSVTWKD